MCSRLSLDEVFVQWGRNDFCICSGCAEKILIVGVRPEPIRHVAVCLWRPDLSFICGHVATEFRRRLPMTEHECTGYGGFRSSLSQSASLSRRLVVFRCNMVPIEKTTKELASDHEWMLLIWLFMGASDPDQRGLLHIVK